MGSVVIEILHCKVPENAPTPTTMALAQFARDRVHAVLGGGFDLLDPLSCTNDFINLVL